MHVHTPLKEAAAAEGLFEDGLCQGQVRTRCHKHSTACTAFGKLLEPAGLTSPLGTLRLVALNLTCTPQACGN
jgi:hypothetical protein